jgi:hypothetical protein
MHVVMGVAMAVSVVRVPVREVRTVVHVVVMVTVGRADRVVVAHGLVAAFRLGDRLGLDTALGST